MDANERDDDANDQGNEEIVIPVAEVPQNTVEESWYNGTNELITRHSLLFPVIHLIRYIKPKLRKPLMMHPDW